MAYNEHDRIADRLAVERRGKLVGRHTELAVIADLYDNPDGPVALYVHGPGGVGKSALLRAAADLAAERGRSRVVVDAADAGPDRSTFLAALGGGAHLDALGGGELGPSGVLIIDTFEVLAPLERWFREEFLPGLPAGCRVLLAGRRPLPAAWRRDPGWRELLVDLPLRNLAPDDAIAVLHSAGVPDDAADALAAQTYGHPLALMIAADTYGTGRGVATLPRPARLMGDPDAVSALLSCFVDEVDTELQRSALHVCGHARRVDRALLRSVLRLADGPADDLLAWLRARPYAVTHPDGLTVHDLVADALDADLRWRDRAAFIDLHHAVRAVIVERMRTRDGLGYHRAAADLLFLHRANPAAASLFSYDSLGSTSAHEYSSADAGDLRRIFVTAESSRRAQWALRCAHARPDAVHLIVDKIGRACGAVVFDRITDSDPPAGDPVAEQIRTAVAAIRPPEPGEVILHECAADAQRPRQLGPVADMVAALSMRAWAAPRLGWVVCSSAHGSVWRPVWEYIGFAALTDLTLDDGTRITMYARDFLRSPFEEWLQSLGDVEAEQSPVPVAVAPMALCRSDFDAAVRDLLRDLHRPDRLAHQPLLGSRLATAPAIAPGTAAEGDLTGARLVEVVRHAVAVVATDQRCERAARALDRTYLRPAPSQERAAELLGMPFSTYRRHLAKGLTRLTDVLWEWELRGVPTGK